MRVYLMTTSILSYLNVDLLFIGVEVVILILSILVMDELLFI